MHDEFPCPKRAWDKEAEAWQRQALAEAGLTEEEVERAMMPVLVYHQMLAQNGALREYQRHLQAAFTDLWLRREPGILANLTPTQERWLVTEWYDSGLPDEKPVVIKLGVTVRLESPPWRGDLGE